MLLQYTLGKKLKEIGYSRYYGEVVLPLCCLDCKYEWKPRKEITRYRRQCPTCNSYHIQELKETEKTEDRRQAVMTAREESTLVLKWPRVVYDLMGISGAASPENALARAFELYRSALPYKFKYNVESPEEVIRLLENCLAAERKKATENEKRLHDVLSDPRGIFHKAVGADLTAVEYYEELRRRGYTTGFLDFLNDVVAEYFKAHGYNSVKDFAGS
jgi:hypothetical protein